MSPGARCEDCHTEKNHRFANQQNAPASEGLRHLARKVPTAILPILELLRADPDLYVRKSVANILRNAGKRDPEFILTLCQRWAEHQHKHTNWVIKDGLRKLRASQPEQVEQIVSSLGMR